MTIAQAVSQLDELTPNPFSREEKLLWLSRAEAAVCRIAGEALPSFTADTDPDTPLFAPEPYDELYLRYLQAQVCLEQGEIGRCNNAMALYNNALAQFHRFHIRENTTSHPHFTNF